MQDWLLGTFESSGTPLNRLVIADCPSFGQGWVGGRAWSCVCVSRLLFYTTHTIAAGAQIRDSHFHEEWPMVSSGKKKGCTDTLPPFLFLLSRGVNDERSVGLCLSLFLLSWAWGRSMGANNLSNIVGFFPCLRIVGKMCVQVGLSAIFFFA